MFKRGNASQEGFAYVLSVISVTAPYEESIQQHATPRHTLFGFRVAVHLWHLWHLSHRILLRLIFYTGKFHPLPVRVECFVYLIQRFALCGWECGEGGFFPAVQLEDGIFQPLLLCLGLQVGIVPVLHAVEELVGGMRQSL